MKEIRGKIDVNDLEFVRKQGISPVMAQPCPIGRGGKINPHITQFLTKDRKTVSVFHIKPIYYLHQNGQWRPLSEIASYYGNKRGMILKEGWENKIDFNYLAWYAKRLEVMKSVYGIAVEYPRTYRGLVLTPTRIPLLLNTTSTFYPDPDPENTSVDGAVYHVVSAGNTWATIRDGAGTNADPGDNVNPFIRIRSHTDSNKWVDIFRSIFLFDASAIGDTDTIDSAILSVYSTGKADGGSWTPNINVYSSAPASNTNLVAGDFGSLGTTAFSTVITYAGWADGYNAFTLNASGLAAISKTVVSKFGLRNANYDVANSAPTWGSNQISSISGYYADQADTTSDPKLVVVHSAPVTANSNFFMFFN